MKSMTEVKTGLKKGLAAILLAAAVCAVPAKADVLCGGAVPLVNYFLAVPNQGIDVQSAAALGAAGHLASIVVTNNAPNSFVMTVTLTNGGFLQQGVAVGAGAAGTYNAFTGAQGYADGRTPLGTAVKHVALATGVVAAGGFAAGSTIVFTGGAQTAATVDYTMDIEASWAATTTLLAGYYAEKLQVSLVAMM